MAGQIVVADVTKYSPKETCPDRPCIMASGEKAYEGAVACPRGVKLRSIAIIDSKVYVCHDRTNKRLDGRYDIFTNDYSDAINWGKQRKTIVVIPE
jgi:3D (Asp-Asp-Asp) domain-containing protein